MYILHQYYHIMYIHVYVYIYTSLCIHLHICFPPHSQIFQQTNLCQLCKLEKIGKRVSVEDKFPKTIKQLWRALISVSSLLISLICSLNLSYDITGLWVCVQIQPELFTRTICRTWAMGSVCQGGEVPRRPCD